MHGQFVWYELSTPDTDAAKKFYPRFTGWGTQAFDADYTMFTHDGAPVAGIFRLTDEMKGQGIPPNWMPYVETDDVSATAARAESLGAVVTAGPGDIPGIGSYAVIRDPQGAVFGIYRSTRDSGAWDGTNVVGRFSWHELMTTDHNEAWAFYSTLFGWDHMGEMDMGGGNMYLLYGKGGKMYGGMYSKTAEMAGMNPFWLVYVHVKDVGKALEIATKAGATVHRPQMDIPGGGSIAILGDPQGAGFALHHAAAPAAEAVRTAVKAVKSAARKVAVLARKASAKAGQLARKAKKTGKSTAGRKSPAATRVSAKTKKKTTRKPVRKPSRTGTSAGRKGAAKKRTKAPTRKAPARKSATKARSRSRARTKKK